MRKLLLFTFIAITTLFFACSGEDNDSTNNCGTVTGLTITQEGNQINFLIAGSGAMYYEVAPVMTGSNASPDDSNAFSFNSVNGSVLAAELGTLNYMFYARTVCDGNNKGNWFGPVAFEIKQFCDTPRDLFINSQMFTWTGYPVYGEEYSNFQIEYGPQGFTHGNGTITTVNQNIYSGFSLAAGQHYDFYVRAYCKNNVGFGNWAGPVSYYADGNVNMCLVPSDLSYEIVSSNTTYATIETSWNMNGEDQFEYALVGMGDPVTQNDIHTISGIGFPTFVNVAKNFDYDLYVRAVCDDGNKTEWIKKQIIF